MFGIGKALVTQTFVNQILQKNSANCLWERNPIPLTWQHPCLFKCIFCKHTLYYLPEKKLSQAASQHWSARHVHGSLPLLCSFKSNFPTVYSGTLFIAWPKHSAVVLASVFIQFSCTESSRFQVLFWPVRCPLSIPCADLPLGRWQQGTLQCQQHTEGHKVIRTLAVILPMPAPNSGNPSQSLWPLM